MTRKTTRTVDTNQTKAQRAGFSLAPNLMAHAIQAAEVRFGGNLSRYLGSLIEADMSTPACSPVVAAPSSGLVDEVALLGSRVDALSNLVGGVADRLDAHEDRLTGVERR